MVILTYLLTAPETSFVRENGKPILVQGEFFRWHCTDLTDSFQGRESDLCNNSNIGAFRDRLLRPENNPSLVVEDPSSTQIKSEVAVSRAGASKE